MTVIFDLRTESKQCHVEPARPISIGQRSFHSKVIVRTHGKTHRTDCFIWTTKVVGNKYTTVAVIAQTLIEPTMDVLMWLSAMWHATSGCIFPLIVGNDDRLVCLCADVQFYWADTRRSTCASMTSTSHVETRPSSSVPLIRITSEITSPWSHGHKAATHWRQVYTLSSVACP